MKLEMKVRELTTDRNSLAEAYKELSYQECDKDDLYRENMELEMLVRELATDRNSLVEANEELNSQVHKLDDELELHAINARTDFAANNQYRALETLHQRNLELEALVRELATIQSTLVETNEKLKQQTANEKLSLQSEIHVLKQEVQHLQSPRLPEPRKACSRQPLTAELAVAMAATQAGCQLVVLLARACATDATLQSLCHQLAKALSTADRALRQSQQLESSCPVVSDTESSIRLDQSYGSKLGVSIEVAPGSQNRMSFC